MNRPWTLVVVLALLIAPACLDYDRTSNTLVNAPTTIHEAPPASPSPSPSPGSAAGPWDAVSVGLFVIGPSCTSANGADRTVTVPAGCNQVLFTATPKRADGIDADAPGALVTWSPDVGAFSTCATIEAPAIEPRYNRTIRVFARGCAGVLAVVVRSPDGQHVHTAARAVVIE